jgi:hypothetical protein
LLKNQIQRISIRQKKILTPRKKEWWALSEGALGKCVCVCVCVCVRECDTTKYGQNMDWFSKNGNSYRPLEFITKFVSSWKCLTQIRFTDVRGECWLWMMAMNDGGECWLWMMAVSTRLFISSWKGLTLP